MGKSLFAMTAVFACVAILAVCFSPSTHANGAESDDLFDGDEPGNGMPIFTTGVCGSAFCSQVYIDSVSVSASTNLMGIDTSGQESAVGHCTPNNLGFFLLDRSTARGSDLYALLLSASLTGKKMSIWLEASPSGICMISYVRLHRE